MPIFRVKGKNIFFFHVPKCAGSSVERSLINSGLKLSFHDVHFRNKWQSISPQHICKSHYHSLFQNDFFDYSFSIVRNPVSRFISAFAYNRKKIGMFRDINSILRELSFREDFSAKKYDNHFTPAVRLIPDHVKVFKLEFGLDRILQEISKDIGIKLPLNIKENTRITDEEMLYQAKTLRRHQIKKVLYKPSPTAEELTNNQKRLIYKIYREDFEKYGYSM